MRFDEACPEMVENMRCWFADIELISAYDIRPVRQSDCDKTEICWNSSLGFYYKLFIWFTFSLL